MEDFDGMEEKTVAVLFDMDGTIIDSNHIVLKVWKETHNTFMPEHPLEEEQMLKYFGKPAQKIYEELQIPPALHQNYQKMFYQKYLSYMKKESRLFPHVVETLKYLKTRNIRLGIITGARQDVAKEILTQHNILSYFDVVVGSDCTPRGKPYPDPVFYAITYLDIEGNMKNVPFVGDTINDLLTAKNAGVKAVLFWPNKQEAIPNTLRENADYIIMSFKDVISLIRE